MKVCLERTGVDLYGTQHIYRLNKENKVNVGASGSRMFRVEESMKFDFRLSITLQSSSYNYFGTPTSIISL